MHTILLTSIGLLGHWSCHLYMYLGRLILYMALICVLTTLRLILKSPAPTSPLTPDLYIQFLLEFSTRMSNRHLTFNNPKTEFLISSLPTCSFLSLPYLSKWQLFYLLKLQGYYFLSIGFINKPYGILFQNIFRICRFILFVPLPPSSSKPLSFLFWIIETLTGLPASSLVHPCSVFLNFFMPFLLTL